MEPGQELNTDVKKRVINVITGIFKDKETAEKAFRVLQERGYSKDQVNMILSEKTKENLFTGDPNSDFAKKAVKNAVIANNTLTISLRGWGLTPAKAELVLSAIKDGAIVMNLRPKDENDAQYFEKAWNVAREKEIVTE
jgi:hypothetical protein